MHEQLWLFILKYTGINYAYLIFLIFIFYLIVPILDLINLFLIYKIPYPLSVLFVPVINL